jgi:uncharacterized protein YjbI with pentapeptide repeats
MKVYKKNHLSLLVKIFGLGDVLYLTATVLVYFDLNDPDTPLKEQDLWKTIPEQLGEQQALDMGFPKPKAEYLVTGKCFAPKGEMRPASQVCVRVGPSTKTLDIFGDRYWLDSNGSHPKPTDPEPFDVMPIDYKLAYGGEGYNRNPIGKGFNPVPTPEGKELHPLPNIELADRLIVSPDEKPLPAGFGPLDLMWSPRHDKVGTYDDKWLAERWPWFPDDFNPEFFNTAPESQFLSDFFKGNEAIEIQNMHPDMGVIRSHVPPLRIRCFVTQMEKPGAPQEKDMFREVKTKADTLWLFPEILRGVLMHRGTLKVKDDEFADIRRIFLASEQPDEEPKTIEYYRDEQEKAADLSVPFDPAPIQAAQEKMKAAMKKVRAVPKEIERIKKQAMGKAPRMQRSLPEVHEITKGVIADRLADLDKMEASSKALHAKFGHKVKINLDMFGKMRGKLQKMDANIDKTVAKLTKTQQELGATPQEMKDQISGAMKSMVPPELFDKVGLDPDNLDLDIEKEDKPWHDEGFAFVLQCRKNLEKNREARDLLDKLGFARQTVKRAWLGINPEEASFDPVTWGLKPENPAAGRPGPLVLPPGLVIPRFEDADLKRIIIRPGTYHEVEGEIAVEGSDEVPLALLSDEGAPVIIAGDDLSAWRVEEEISDLCSVISMKDPGAASDDPAASALEKASGVLVILSASKAESEPDWQPWAEAFPNAQKLVLPEAETVFEAWQNGEDIRQWILKALPPEIAREHIIEPYEPEPGAPPGKFTLPAITISAAAIKDMVNKAVAEVHASFQPMKDEMLAKQEEVREAAKKAVAKAGLDPDKVMAGGGPAEESMAKNANAAADKLAQNRQTLKSKGMLPPEAEARLKEAEDKVRQRGQEAEAKWQDGQAKLAAGREKVAAAKIKAQSGALPASAKEKMLAHGIDIDKRRKLTREEVVELYGQGESLSQAIVSGVDLSELDLPGIDLSKATCKGTIFAKSNLEGANFTEAIAKGADFSECRLAGAKFHKGIFIEGIYKKADLKGADFEQALLKKADFSQADAREARLDMSILSQAVLNKTRFAKADLKQCIIDGADATEADFSQCRLKQCLFKKANLTKANFTGAEMAMTLFYGATGTEVNFSSANMDQSRMGGNTALPGADFRNASMHEVCYRDSDLAGATFESAVLFGSILENCDLTKACFSRTSAKKTRLIKSNLEEADMWGLNLFQGSLRKSRLINADLRDSNLFGVDFYKAIFGDTLLDNANLKRTQIYKRTEFL